MHVMLKTTVVTATLLCPATAASTGVDSALTHPEIASRPDSSMAADSALRRGEKSKAPQPPQSIRIEGIVVDESTGEFPESDSITVIIGHRAAVPDSEGTFEFSLPPAEYYVLQVTSRNYAPFRKTVVAEESRDNYFVSCVLQGSDRRDISPEPKPILGDSVPGPPWTLSGNVIDSRLDLAVESDSGVVIVDGRDTLAVSDKGTFMLETHIPGTHTLHLIVPGYHETHETVALTEEDRQPYLVLPTTGLKHEVTRRVITVSAKRQPVHSTAEVSKTKIPRKELKRTAATLSDPVRTLHTLPGVASESDASARPLVRGGDVLESRVFLDGISLIQPYHFGGMRSSFNQQTMDNLTIYRSGFPARYHNAQSALVIAQSRNPTDENLALELDLNPLQYAGYLGIPLRKKTVGITATAQGSYYDFMIKRIGDLIVAGTRDEDAKREFDTYKKQTSLPDYQDFGCGVYFTPNDRLRLSINETFNTDRFRFTEAHRRVKYFYFDHDSRGRRYLDTVVVREQDLYTDPEFDSSYQFFAGRSWDSLDHGTDDLAVDTLMFYSSNYNILRGTARYVPSPEHIFTFSGAWQRRWWDLNFPDAASSYIDSALFDVTVNAFSLNTEWLYSGIPDHLITSGIQVDYTRARYDVFLVRFLHEIITTGSTNFENFWGPISGDTAMAIIDSGDDDYLLGDLLQRLLVRYRGRSSYPAAGLFAQDEWTVSPRLTIDAGARVEVSEADTSVTFSPRAAAEYKLTDNHELIGSAGHYTQNNYQPAAVALSRHLNPEKVVHGSVGLESELLPWLRQKVDLYGKYYYHLLSEVIEPSTRLHPDSLERLMQETAEEMYALDESDTITEDIEEQLLLSVLMNEALYGSYYTNKGRGCAAGLEYFLRFDPTDFWHGWLSISYGRSFRRRKPGWRLHAFPFERPLLISFVNYYRLPRRYELSVKYRFMSGIPYTNVSFGTITKVGDFNARRYYPYQRLDFKIAKGFTIGEAKCHFYYEIWNALNTPNMFLTDSKTRKIQTTGFNLPFTALFVGLDLEL